jgi:hypothetical protein
VNVLGVRHVEDWILCGQQVFLPLPILYV